MCGLFVRIRGEREGEIVAQMQSQFPYRLHRHVVRLEFDLSGLSNQRPTRPRTRRRSTACLLRSGNPRVPRAKNRCRLFPLLSTETVRPNCALPTTG
ncbi:hypothetical protein KI387_041734, partial [Taxus chinensis]